MDEASIALIAIVSTLALFVVLPGMILHYITLWRRQKTLQPDDERMLEDLWRSAKAMERRIETLEALLEKNEADAPRRPPRPSRSTFED
ncbi:MAG: envelope stress response membrane protein PspB [Hyphomonas sp.]|jgi:phage shock protein B|uniref:envelope stress response membrane protein PspB n=1 Tax=Hyphomonas sp. TaxID=87 RepID=UPI0018445B1A|nr:envelope stress response membrane protein PspB [Hyphomonas sp.]MBA3068874.1 envelope stress response membrane protein PspB [Hyphomonas sp.]MBU4062914.1 envelope stress response membrane protein PspB [Alphaproteobacteria bacterium]MBU4165446.1 envelope stress response membrane protein PspB [Alphaproteobacteria bacterium]